MFCTESHGSVITTNVENKYGDTAMNDYEFLQTTMQMTQLSSSTEYRQAMLLSRRRQPENLARATKDSEEYASLRFLIGTWNTIAFVCASFNAKQRNQFFRNNPISLVWRHLEPAITIIRNDTDETFAKEFADLHEQYQKWSGSKAGERYTTAQLQAINALFFV